MKIAERERPLIFFCNSDRLVGVLHAEARAASVGIVIVVGGPQYRAGSHRQFVLMARAFAREGYPVLRFDHRGIGDSDGEARSFLDIHEDIRSAVDAFVSACPGLTRVVLLGLCDAASANLMYCSRDERVTGLILLNPWVRTSQGEARSYLRHYYPSRLLQASFWKKVVSGKYELRKSLREFARSIVEARAQTGEEKDTGHAGHSSFISEMREGLASFGGRVLFLISGKDLTAGEFMDLCQRSEAWRRSVGRPNVTFVSFTLADHTMSSRADLDSASKACVEWLRAWKTVA